MILPFYIIRGDDIVTKDLYFNPQPELADPLDEIVGERIVVIDNDDHGHNRISQTWNGQDTQGRVNSKSPSLPKFPFHVP